MIADGKFPWAEQLAIGATDQAAGDFENLIAGFLVDLGGKGLGVGFLLRGEFGASHDATS